MDNANAKTGCSEGDGDEMHFFSKDLGRLDGKDVKALKMMNDSGFIFDLNIESKFAERPWNVRAIA